MRSEAKQVAHLPLIRLKHALTWRCTRIAPSLSLASSRMRPSFLWMHW